MKILKDRVQLIFKFVLLSSVPTLAILFLFLFNAPRPEFAIDTFYLSTLPLYYYFFILLLTLLLLPITFSSKLSYLIIIPKAIFDLFLLTDFAVYSIYRFHIDSMFIDMAINDFAGLGLSTTAIVTILIVVLCIVVLNFFAYMIARKRDWRFLAKVNITLLLVFAFGQFTHAWGFAYNQKLITQYTPRFPHYYPLTSQSNVEKATLLFPAIEPSITTKNSDDSIAMITDTEMGQSIFNYPKQKIEYVDASIDKPNILFVVLESWRADSLTPEVMPNLYKFAQDSHLYSNHYSGGTVTVSGLFSMLYGLHPTYLNYAQSSPIEYQSQLTRSLTHQGYDIKVFTTQNLDRFNLKPMAFGNISDENYYETFSLGQVENDYAAHDGLIQQLDDKPDEPWFKFVMFTSSHSFYQYPDEFEKYTPVASSELNLVMNKDADSEPFVNKYKNSLLFLDSVFESLHQKLIEQELLEDTIIIVTGDHAEEFNDNGLGYWGHGSNYTKFQSQVPLIIHYPDRKGGVVEDKMTTHVDIVPTLLESYLGVANDISVYSSGVNLLDSSSTRKGIIQTSYENKGYLFNEVVYSIGIDVESYQIDDIGDKNLDIDYQKIRELRQEEIDFLN